MVRTNDFYWLEWLYWWEQNEEKNKRERETEDEAGVSYIIF